MQQEQSQTEFERACQLFPGGVNSPVRAFQAVEQTPIFIEKGQGAYLWDLDGNRYIDFVLSWGPLIAGHANPAVVAAIQKQAAKGTSFGATTALESELAERIQNFFPSMEMMRFVSSGTEATMSAIRLARGVTNRPYILKFEGCYHGHADAFLVKAGSGLATFGVSSSAGIPEAIAQLTITIPYNDLAALETCFAQFGDQIAGAIVEPIAGNMGLVEPTAHFIQLLREKTQQFNALLIFDEVMTGMRVAKGGAQAYFNIDPDLTILGKVVGGGMPLAVYGGKQLYMKEIAPDGPVYQAGTLSGNPLAVVAGIATLKLITNEQFDQLADRLADFCSQVTKLAQSYQLAIQVPHVGTMFTIYFNDAPVTNFDEAKRSNVAQYAQFHRFMLEEGVYFAPSQFEANFVSFAHTKEVFDHVLNSVEKCFQFMQKSFAGSTC